MKKTLLFSGEYIHPQATVYALEASVLCQSRDIVDPGEFEEEEFERL
ncbi:MAG: hypothetical protein IJ686_04210 [Bacteroidales bacterium]|nr:hypothetical protein [Bacteroidales bacterium]